MKEVSPQDVAAVLPASKLSGYKSQNFSRSEAITEGSLNISGTFLILIIS